MSGVLASAQSGVVVATRDSGESRKTILQIEAAANHRVVVTEWSVSFNGESNTALPANVEIRRQTTAGTMSALTPEKLDPSDDETIQTTAQEDATVEPTTGNEVEGDFVHLQGGLTLQSEPGIRIVVPGGTRLALCVVTDEVVSCKARLKFDE